MMFKHHQVPEPRPRGRLVGRLTIGCPEVGCAAESFLDTVVKVIAERADVGFDLDNGHEIAAGAYDQIPIFGRPEIARQGFLGDEYLGIAESGIPAYVGDNADKAVPVFAASYRRPVPASFCPVVPPWFSCWLPRTRQK